MDPASISGPFVGNHKMKHYHLMCLPGRALWGGRYCREGLGKHRGSGEGSWGTCRTVWPPNQATRQAPLAYIKYPCLCSGMQREKGEIIIKPAWESCCIADISECTPKETVLSAELRLQLQHQSPFIETSDIQKV